MNIVCRSFKAYPKNTLRGFASIMLVDVGLTILDVSLHEKNGSRWAALPSKPMIDRNGVALKDEATGKIKYIPMLELADREHRDAFSKAVVAAVLQFDPHALEATPF